MTNTYNLETAMLRGAVKDHVVAFNLENGNPFDLEHFMTFIKNRIDSDYSPRFWDMLTNYTRHEITFEWGGTTHRRVSRLKIKDWDKKAMDAWTLVHETISSSPIWDALKGHIDNTETNYITDLTASIIKPIIVSATPVKSSVTGLTHHKVMSMNGRCDIYMNLFSTRDEAHDFADCNTVRKTYFQY